MMTGVSAGHDGRIHLGRMLGVFASQPTGRRQALQQTRQAVLDSAPPERRERLARTSAELQVDHAEGLRDLVRKRGGDRQQAGTRCREVVQRHGGCADAHRQCLCVAAA